MIRQICNIRPQDIVTTRSNELLERLGIEDLDLILRREEFDGLDIRNAPVVQSRQPLTYRLMESVGLGGSVGCASDWRPGGRGFDPRRGRQHSFVEIDHEIFSTVILSLPLIQEGQLSVSGERMCTILVNR